MFTTCAMIKLGKVYGNLMVDLRATNKKLVDRSKRLIIHATGATPEEAARVLKEAGGHTKLAILMRKAGCDAARGRELLGPARAGCARPSKRQRGIEHVGSLSAKGVHRVVGMMSGTSVDGVDAALSSSREGGAPR